MKKKKTAVENKTQNTRSLAKAPTGIRGLDAITSGGLPKGRSTLVCGGAGCGKTLFAMEFLVSGAEKFGEPGIFVSFEETPDELMQNVSVMGYDLHSTVAKGQVKLDHIRIDRTDTEEVGDYDLEGLFIRLGYLIDSIGAKRVVLDTIEVLFAGLSHVILRSELRRLFRWLKEKRVTAIITGERGVEEGTLTRYGLEEYVADCVILLDHRVDRQISTRHLRIVKYRGSTHGTNEYPFLIDEKGLSVLPITSLTLDHDVTTERVSSGVPRLDTMLGNKGFYRGSSILITGVAGAGKSSLAATFANTVCTQGKRCLYFAFEESPQQICRNMASIGLNLENWTKKGLLKIHAARPHLHGLEQHLVAIHSLVSEFKPDAVVIDPLSNLVDVGRSSEVKGMLTRLIDSLKEMQITMLMTCLIPAKGLENTEFGISSLMDTWILLRAEESNGERNRVIQVLKARGMSHSNQVREFLLSKNGIDLVDVYLGETGVLTGTARLREEQKSRGRHLATLQELERRKRQLDRRRRALDAKVQAMQVEFEEDEEEVRRLFDEKGLSESRFVENLGEQALLRRADENSAEAVALKHKRMEGQLS